jgi:8-oxo-dGTP pyrophosphatase MutT (NUDIX family)
VFDGDGASVTSARAHVFVMREDTMLVLQQAGGLRWWEQPGGELVDGESPADASIRETLEETGLRLDRVDLLRQWSYRNKRGEDVACFAYVALAPPGAVRLSDEHTAHAWISIADYAERYCGERVTQHAPQYADFLLGMRENCRLLGRRLESRAAT